MENSTSLGMDQEICGQLPKRTDETDEQVKLLVERAQDDG